MVSGLQKALLRAQSGATCPYQWLPANYDPITHHERDDKHLWFVVGANAGGLGGTVFRLTWRYDQAEEWFQLHPGDFVMDVIWTEKQGWQALVAGGDPHCSNTQPGNEAWAISCALQSGAIYLVDDRGNYDQLLGPDGIGRCEGVFNPSGTAVAFRESILCFTSAEQNASSRIVVVDLDSQELWRLPGDGQQYGPYWSPDGTQLAFTVVLEAKPIGTPSTESASARISQPQVVNVWNRQVIPLPSLVDNSSASCSLMQAPDVWSPDGQKLLCNCSIWAEEHRRETLVILDVSKGSVTEIDTFADSPGYWPGAAWIDSDTVEWKIVGPRPGAELKLFDLRTGDTRSLFVEPSYNWTWLRRSPDGNMLALLRTTKDRSYIDLFAWHDLAITTTVELPQDAEWVDLYWVSE